MTGWIRTHPYTILAMAVLAAIAGWLAVTRQPRAHWLLAAAWIGMCAWRGIARGHRKPSALPCPPECRIRVAHWHERLK